MGIKTFFFTFECIAQFARKLMTQTMKGKSGVQQGAADCDVWHVPPTTILDLFNIFEGVNWFFWRVGWVYFLILLSSLSRYSLASKTKKVL